MASPCCWGWTLHVPPGWRRKGSGSSMLGTLHVPLGWRRKGSGSPMLGTLHVPPGWRRKGPGCPPPLFAFGKASCKGAVIPAVNIHFTGLLMGTRWQKGASRPPHSAAFLSRKPSGFRRGQRRAGARGSSRGSGKAPAPTPVRETRGLGGRSGEFP